MKIFNNQIFLIVVIFSFLKPSGFDIYNMTTINSLLNIIRIFFALLITIKYIGTFQRMSVLITAEFIYFVFLFISSIINNSNLNNFSIFAISVIVFTMLIEIYMNERAYLILNALFFNYFIILSTNLFLMYYIHGFKSEQSVNEMQAISFISSDNLTASYLFPGLCIGFLYSIFKRDKFNLYTIILYIVILLTALKIWSATSLVGIVIILVYIFIIHGSVFATKIRFSYLLITDLVLIISLTFFKIQALFYFLIVDILEKDISMTGRTNIWEIGLKGFDESPIIGRGYSAMVIDNGVIQLLFSGGLLGFCLYIILFLIGARKLFTYNKRDISLQCFFSFVLFTILIMAISESWFSFFGFFIILSLANNTDKLTKYFIHKHSWKYV